MQVLRINSTGEVCDLSQRMMDFVCKMMDFGTNFGNFWQMLANFWQLFQVDMIGDEKMLEGHWKWHGGVLHANGNLYGCPCNSDRVLKIEPETATVSLVGGPFPGSDFYSKSRVLHSK